MATKKRAKAGRTVARTQEQKSEITVGKCARITIHVRTNCGDGKRKPDVRLAKAKSASSKEAPVMYTMSGSGPTGSGGGGGQTMLSIDIYVDVNE